MKKAQEYTFTYWNPYLWFFLFILGFIISLGVIYGVFPIISSFETFSFIQSDSIIFIIIMAGCACAVLVLVNSFLLNKSIYTGTGIITENQVVLHLRYRTYTIQLKDIRRIRYMYYSYNSRKMGIYIATKYWGYTVLAAKKDTDKNLYRFYEVLQMAFEKYNN